MKNLLTAMKESVVKSVHQKYGKALKLKPTRFFLHINSWNACYNVRK